MKCGIMLVGMYYIVPICNCMSVKLHIVNGIAISWIIACCVILVTSPTSNQIAAVGQNTPTPTNNFDMQLGARTKDWVDITVVMKCSKCAKSRNTVPVEGKKAAGLDGIAHTENPQEKGENAQKMLEDMQEGVVQALTTQAPPPEAFTGVHEYERGTGFGLGEHTTFRAITEGVTADEAFPEGVDTLEDNDCGPRRGPRRGSNQAVTILNCLPCLNVAMGLLSMSIMVLAQLMAYVGDMGTAVVSSLR